MIHAQEAKYIAVLPPISAAGSASWTTTEVDCLGWRYAEFIVQLGLIPATGVATIKIQESDVTGSGQVDITGAGFTAPVDADDGKVLGCFLDLRKRKRFLTLVATNGATNASLLSALCRLSRGEIGPSTAAARGLKEQLTP